jgi:copper chaperone CopZ
MYALHARHAFPSLIIILFLLCHAFSFEHSHPLFGLQSRTRPEPSEDSTRTFPVSSRTKLPSLGNPTPRNEGNTILSANVQIESSPSTRIAASYHLLWTRGFATKFALSTLALALGHHFVIASPGFPKLSIAFRGSLSSIGLSLLASSCCLFQILANVFAGTVGCLGLNTALGPSRPYFLSLLFYLTFAKSAMSLPQILLRFSIAFLPEMMHTWNNRHKFLHSKNAPSIDSGMIMATLEFDVPSMGCVACINKIDSTLRNNKGYEKVVDVTSWLDPALPKGGATKVTLTVESKEEAEAIGESLVETFDSIGFGGSSISKLEVSKSTTSQSWHEKERY